MNWNCKPIPFDTEAVRAILDRRKTVTRRVVKPQPPSETHPNLFVTPPYRPGHVLYVQEAWCKTDCFGLQDAFAYKANDNSILEQTGFVPKWRSPRHMPREAARIFLKVTNVRVERLQDIGGPEIIIKEGVSSDPYDYQSPEWYDDHPELLTESARAAFAGFWNSTIKPTDHDTYGWDANPWVWVIESERCAKPEEV